MSRAEKIAAALARGDYAGDARAAVAFLLGALADRETQLRAAVVDLAAAVRERDAERAAHADERLALREWLGLRDDETLYAGIQRLCRSNRVASGEAQADAA